MHPRINKQGFFCNCPFHRADKTLNESKEVIRPGRGEWGKGEGGKGPGGVSTLINAGNQANLEHLQDNLR